MAKTKKLVKKNCAICGKDIIDKSRNQVKMTCSPKCRREYYYQQNPGLHHKTKLRLRLNMLERQGTIVTEQEKQDISNKIKLGLCQICGKKVEARKWLHIDHCHTSHKYRDVICQSCNFTIGFIETYPDSIALCQKYIEKHNARLGVDND